MISQELMAFILLRISWSCTKSNNYFVEYSIGYAIKNGKVIMRSNNRCTDLAYIHFFKSSNCFAAN